MKIPSKNHQFTNKPTLILVTSAQEAVLYWAENGEVTDIMEIVADKKQDSDRPGISKVKGPNEVHHGIALEEKQQKLKEKAVKDLLSKMRRNLKGVEGLDKVKSVFLYTPDFMEEGINSVLPREIKKRVEKTFLGNFAKEHPIDLIRKIDSFLDDKKVVPTDEEAVKILKKGERES